MQVIDNRALLLRVRNPALITQVIPKSERLSDNEVLVHWGLEESQILKNLQVKNVPSPILGRYNWGGLFKPLEHQKTTAAFLTLHRKAFCFNEQGTGKTASAIWAADYLMNVGLVKRVLIICPLSVMDQTWRKEVFNCAMHRSVDIAHGTRDKRSLIVRGPAEFVVINFDGVEIVRDDIVAAGFDLIVVDEASAFKTATTKRWKILNHIVKQLGCRLWMMTGTPAAQSPLDAYGLAKLINPTAVPTFFGAYRDVVMTKVSTFRWVPRPDAPQTVHSILQPAIRFTKDECLDLPERTYVQREVALTTQQKKYYELLRSRMTMDASGEAITAVNAAVLMGKLLQISCGAAYSDGGETLEFDISNRYKVLTEVIDESSQKVLVFAPYRNIITLLSERLNKDGYSTEVIHGGVKAGDRSDIISRFQSAPNPRVLVLQPQAAGHGITLTAANTVVWWGPTTSLETFAQANDRVHRTGQRHPTTVVCLEGSAVERKIYKMLDSKIDVYSQITNLYKELLN